MDKGLHNTLKFQRERLGLSQQALAARVGVSRQAILAIEAGRQVPATTLCLQLAHALGCRVEELFQLSSVAGLPACVVSLDGSQTHRASERVTVGEVDGEWVAHRLSGAGRQAADAVLLPEDATGSVRVRPLAEPHALRHNVLVAGCAPLIGALSQRIAGRFRDSRLRWLTASSRAALHALVAGHVHVAGLHLAEGSSPARHMELVREAFPAQRMWIVHLTRWRQGLVVPAGNPLGLREVSDLLRPGLRVAGREEGAGAHTLVRRRLQEAGANVSRLSGPQARGHVQVAELVRCGAADVGVAIESVALAAGLAFVPLSEERFDLVLPAHRAESPPVARLLAALDDPGFRVDVAHLPGYDGGLSGQITRVQAVA